MIRRQMRGPVAESYRDRAGEIARQAGRLMAAVEDLDVAARIEGRRLDVQRAEITLAPLLARARAEAEETARARGVAIAADVPASLPPAIGDAAAVGRIITRLFTAAVALAAPGEVVRLEAVEQGAAVAIRVARPPALAAIADERLFDPTFDAAAPGDDAPLLGLGFTLLLARRLAAASGGELHVAADWFTLRLPVAAGADDGAG